MNDIITEERRQSGRLHYPTDQRPTLMIGDMKWPVSDISETGLAFISNDYSYRLRQPFFAFVIFTDGTTMSVDGMIVRMTRDRVIAACFNKGISRERIQYERLRLKQGDNA